MIPLRHMTIDDHAAVLALLQATPGVSVRDADSRLATARYLDRNPGLSFVADDGGVLAGCVMSGHDGRRGYLYHLAVHPAYRRQGIGRRLTEACIAALQDEGIFKTHLFVFASNDLGRQFWESIGWQFRDDIAMYSYNGSLNPNI